MKISVNSDGSFQCRLVRYVEKELSLVEIIFAAANNYVRREREKGNEKPAYFITGGHFTI